MICDLVSTAKVTSRSPSVHYRFSFGPPGKRESLSRAPDLFLPSHDASRVDLDQWPREHDSRARHEGESRSLGGIGELLAPYAREAAVVAPRLDQIEPNMVAVVPIRFVGLELPGQHLEGEAGLLLDIREVVRQAFRGVVV